MHHNREHHDPHREHHDGLEDGRYEAIEPDVQHVHRHELGQEIEQQAQWTHRDQAVEGLIRFHSQGNGFESLFVSAVMWAQSHWLFGRCSSRCRRSSSSLVMYTKK